MACAARIREDVAPRIAAFAERHGRPPGLGVVLAGQNPASEVYVRNKIKTVASAGCRAELFRLDAVGSLDEALALVRTLNADEAIDGILVQSPLPTGMGADAEQRVFDAIDPAKDVDGFHPQNVGLLVQKRPALVACTPLGCIELLEREGIPMKGKHAVVIGRSDIVGKPMAMLLLHRDATVTICHSRTVGLAAVARTADILVAAIGRPGFVTRDFVKPGATVIDVGINTLTTRGRGRAVVSEREPQARGVCRKGQRPGRRRAPERGRGCRRGDAGAGRRRAADGGDGAAQHRNGGGTPGNRKGGEVIRKVALTGGIATGKSYVANRLREAGIPMVDADLLARDVVAPGTPALSAIRKRFGPDAVRRDGTMDRVRVGQIVFKDKRARLDLEAIIHPAVIKAVSDFFAGLPKRTPFAVADIPLVFETGRDKEFDAIIVVACPREMQLQRLMERNKLSKEDAERRLAAQLPIEQKVKKATYVINNDGTFESTNAQVDALIQKLNAK